MLKKREINSEKRGFDLEKANQELNKAGREIEYKKRGFDLEKANQELNKAGREIEYKKRELDKTQSEIDNILDQLKKDFGIENVEGLEKEKKRIEFELESLIEQVSKEYEELMDSLEEKGIKV